MWFAGDIRDQLKVDLKQALTEDYTKEWASGMKPVVAQPASINKQNEKLNTLISSYESSRKILTDILDLDTVVNAKTSEALMHQLVLLTKVVKAEGALREQFLTDLKKLGE
jgi:hypothetical protein